jgi:FkbM family methyltransferase
LTKPSLLQRLATRIGTAVGRNSPVIRLLRPAYERWLDRTSRGKGFLVTINGHERFYVNPRHRAWFGDTYEPEVFAYLRERVAPGAVVLNVGAHVGIYSISLAMWSAPGGQVFAFEPNPATRKILADQIARNGLADRVEIVPKAVAASPGTATFCASGEEGFSRLGRPNPSRSEGTESIAVEVTTIDAFCGQRGVIPDWITLDIEGYEAAALAGARRTIASRGTKLGLIVEMHPSLWPLSGTSRRELEALFAELHVVPRGLTGQRDPLQESGVVALEHIASRPAACIPS